MLVVLKKKVFTAVWKFIALPSWLIDRDQRNDGVENRWKVYLSVEKITKNDWLNAAF